MPLTIDEVEHIARLARLALSQEELAQQCVHLNGLFARLDELREIDLTLVEPTAQGGEQAGELRADLFGPSLQLEAVLAAAPEAAGGYFAVPAILDPDAE
ncbi:MAG: Asp-tRNA(Asn)/Glu-tRNA(Gln) amidotransferase subunit GatC [Armatimonadetes bacterium]|nr:Asp-tRNA(Asn)/Glu-tRNA(Gln) amidotransferase subunit GatC [Armatimonadota bacterium]MDE2206803.1 Asp-tRNA(Asn)/Glu-tRNA(Gln) amidotransferase subunit GatC [Armatimonadota bacterium]